MQLINKSTEKGALFMCVIKGHEYRKISFARFMTDIFHPLAFAVWKKNDWTALIQSLPLISLTTADVDSLERYFAFFLHG